MKTVNGNLLINATPIGMAPYAEEAVVDEPVLSRFEALLDVIVSVSPTPLIKKAEKLGLATVPGYKMSLYQAARQFELYTEQEAPLDVMEQSLKAFLRRA